MKRLLAITPTYYPQFGGAERTAKELCGRLAQLDYDVTLVTPNLGGDAVETTGGFSVFRVGRTMRSRASKFVAYQWWTLAKIRELARAQPFQVVNIMYGFPNVFVQRWLRRNTSSPIVITEFHMGTGMDIIRPEQNPWFVTPTLRWAYRNADAVTAISTEQARFVQQVSGRSDTTIVFQGTDPNMFHPRHRQPGLKQKLKISGPMLLTVSRLNLRKNIGDQIEALAIVRRQLPDTTLVVVGDGDERTKLAELAHRTGQEGHVRFVGFVDEQQLPSFYATADVFTFSSRYEGFGIASCEALASGTPVITYDTTAARDFIQQGATGYVTGHSPQALADRLLGILSDPQILRTMSAAARQSVEENYTWHKYTLRHKAVFDAVITARK